MAVDTDELRWLAEVVSWSDVPGDRAPEIVEAADEIDRLRSALAAAFAAALDTPAHPHRPPEDRVTISPTTPLPDDDAAARELSCRTGEDRESCRSAIATLIDATGCSTDYAVDALAPYAAKGLRLDVVAVALASVEVDR